MQRALNLAMNGSYSTISNPAVGCVLVQGDNIIGEGWHQGDGAPHAEVAAIKDAQAKGESTAGCTAYVSLEPCCHTGKQPPCTQALINARVSRVVVASEDPHSQVAGKGLAVLSASGIEVHTGLLRQQAQALNAGFFYRQQTGLPLLRLKLAISLDGRIAAADGTSAYISCEHSRQDVMHWRARSQALLTTSGTVLADNPRHTVRGIANVTQPDLWLIDSKGKVPFRAQSFAPAKHLSKLSGHKKACRQVFWLRPALAIATANKLPEHINIIPVNGRVELRKLLQKMAQQGANEVLTECGGTLAGGLIAAGLVNQLLIYQAPLLLGDKGLPMARLNIATMVAGRKLTLLESRGIGTDTRLMYKIS